MFGTVIGIVLVLVLAAALFVGWSAMRFAAAIGTDRRRLVGEAKRDRVVVTEAMLENLPEPARRYFHHAGVAWQPIPRIVTLRQTGRIRGSATAKWMNLEAEEVYSTSPPAFLWRAWMPSRRLPIVFGRDEYLGGKGSILMRMAGAFRLAEENGPELGPAGLMRYLNEMTWFPAAYLGDDITVTSEGKDSFRVTINDRGMSATGIIFVNKEGQMTNFSAQRFNTTTRSIETWETPLGEQGEFEGLLLPAGGKAVWRLKTGDFDYVELHITDVKYDEPLLQ